MKNRSSIYSRYFIYIKPFSKLPIVKTYSSPIFTLLVMIIFILFAIKPTIETILILQKKLIDSSQVLEKVTEKAKNLSLGKKNYEELGQDIKDKISTSIPDTVSLKSLTQTLEQSAKINEASVSALQIQPLTIETKTTDHLGSISEISFTFNIEGSYKNLVSVLQNLKSSARLISIDTLSFNKLADRSGLIMSISGKAYYIK